MPSKTDIANSALSYLSAGSIQSLGDTGDEKARAIKAVFETCARQVIRSHRWLCCMERAELSKLADAPVKSGNFGYNYQYQLPANLLRLCEVNGEEYSPRTRLMDLNGRKLLLNDDKAFIRYVAWVDDTSQWDELMAEAVAVRIAGRVARRLTKDGLSREGFEQIYRKVLAEAVAVNAMEVGSGENNPIQAMLESSPLVNAGRSWGIHGFGLRTGSELDISEGDDTPDTPDTPDDGGDGIGDFVVG